MADSSSAPAPATDAWSVARRHLDGLPAGRGINIAHEAVDRHVAGTGDRVAIRWLPRAGDPQELTYEALARRTNRFANALAGLGHGQGTRVASLTGRIPDLYVAALGTLKARAVFTPLFSAFGPEPIRQRMTIGETEVLVTTPALYRRRIEAIRDQLPTLRTVILCGEGDGPTGEGVHRLDELVDAADDAYEIGPTDPEDMALLHFTSGTTGAPKGVVHVHGAVVAHHATGALALDLHPGDVFWCTADPGWVTGTSYGIISPLTNAVTSIVDEGDFDADRWYGVVESERVDVWYTAPTAIRLLARAGLDVARRHDLSSLRLVASVGEPLDAGSVTWGEQVFGRPILDNWWQTETGGIMIANTTTQPVRPGSMGRPLPGVEATILRRDALGEVVLTADGDPVQVDDPDEIGELALRAGWPSMFRAYLGQPERYARCFVGPWYRTGDLARRDSDGYYWFVGRGDDLIKSAGHLIGPFEVETTLLEHAAVAEAGVIGVPDETAGQVVKAFVVLAEGVVDTAELRRELLGFARGRLGVVAPRQIEVVAALPHTRSGKIMRRLLLARELGLDEGDTSTLETGG